MAAGKQFKEIAGNGLLIRRIQMADESPQVWRCALTLCSRFVIQFVSHS
jgi:hypothetical protein